MRVFTSHGRAESVIAIGRIVLAAVCLLAVPLDPMGPGAFSRMATRLLTVYLAYSALLFALLWVLPKLPRLWGAATQGIDLAAFLIFMSLTGGTESPLYIYLTFSLATATVRWQWRGTAWTAAIAISAFVTMGYLAARVARDPTFDWNDFIVRAAHLAVIATMFGYLGTYYRRVSDERSRLAAWPRMDTGQSVASVHELLDHAAGIVQAPRMLMIWEETQNPRIRVACRSDVSFDIAEESAEMLGSLVAEPLAGKNFFCADAASAAAPVLVTSTAGKGKSEWRGAPLDPRLREKFRIGPVISWSLHGEAVEGRLFGLDKSNMSWDDLILGEVVASLTVARMDHYALRERLREAAAADERIRLSRDLHDGLLQSLTGVALQLQVARRMLDREPQEARKRLAEIQATVASEQRDLRAFVNRLKPETSGATTGATLSLRLEDICQRIERQWGLRARLHGEGLADELPPLVGEDVYRIVQEALVNAARHAEATSIQADVTRSDGAIFITVSDDGHGFSFRGTYDLVTLQQMKAGPITLKERVSALGGDLVISSTESGSRLSISLPLPRTTA